MRRGEKDAKAYRGGVAKNKSNGNFLGALSAKPGKQKGPSERKPFDSANYMWLRRLVIIVTRKASRGNA